MPPCGSKLGAYTIGTCDMVVTMLDNLIRGYHMDFSDGPKWHEGDMVESSSNGWLLCGKVSKAWWKFVD